MRSSPPVLPELSLDSRFSPEACARKTIGDISGRVSRSRGASEQISKLEDYANRLRDEMKKIDAFKRELPLCMILLTDAIVAMEEEIDRCRKSNSEPVLEEFMPLKISCRDEKAGSSGKDAISCSDKMNWMSSVQLWNFDLNGNSKEENTIDPSVPGKEKMDGLIVSPSLSLRTPEIMKNSREGVITPAANGFSSKSCSSSRSGSSSGTNNIEQSNARKQRRCWSPELHRRFTNALQQLGGAQAATPKQIRELMQVDGLTNDEVKSHLQKYRLHARRLSSQSVSLWMSEQQCNESSLKHRKSKSGSPEGPLHLEGSPEGNSGSNEDEDY